MKKVFIILLGFILFSCQKVEFMDQQLIEGKISEIENYTNNQYLIYIQNSKSVSTFFVPRTDEYRNKFKIGDTITLVVQRWKVKED